MSNTDEKKADKVDVKNPKDETEKTDDDKLKENQSQVNEAKKESNGEKNEADKTTAAETSINTTMEDSVVSEAGNVGDNEDETEEEEEELPPGLLEKPIEVVGKRERKKTSRFIPDAQQPTEAAKKELKVPDGKGMELSKHPHVVTQLAKNKVVDLQLIHKLLFGAKAPKKSIKLVRSNILKFKGFDFEKDTPAFEKKEEEVGRFTVSNLKWVMEVCGVCEHISILKSKDDLVDTFMEWSLNPQPSAKATPSSKKKQATKRKKTTSGDGETTTDSATPVKVARKKTTKKNKTKKSEGGSEEAESDEEDSSQPPTNAQIKKFIEKVLKGANLEELTMKSVFVQVYAKYPLHDLTDRKPFIKETVKKLISR